MKNYYRLLCAILSFVMVVSLFAGCGETEKSSAEPTTEAPTEAPTEVTTEPVKQIAVLNRIDVAWMDDDSYTVGKELTLDEAGRISVLAEGGDTFTFTYNEFGALSRVDMDDSGTIGHESWVYEDSTPVSSEYKPNTYRSAQDVIITTETDAQGRIIKLTESITYTDSDDGSKSTGVCEYRYIYDEAGRISSAEYYSKGKLDHTTNLTYDENGNLLVYSNVGSELGEYLRVEFSYQMVDEGTIIPEEVDTFTQIYNFTNMLEYIL